MSNDVCAWIGGDARIGSEGGEGRSGKAGHGCYLDSLDMTRCLYETRFYAISLLLACRLFDPARARQQTQRAKA